MNISLNRFKSLTLLVIVSSTLFSMPLAAQEEAAQTPTGSPPQEEAVPSPQTEQYKGVTPGQNDVVEHTRVRHLPSKASNELTWVGFQKEDGKDRVFLQFDNIPAYEITPSGQTLVIHLPDTAPTAKNFERPIDASAFKSRVSKITTSLNKRKRETTVTITFVGDNNSSTSTDNGYLFIDFPQQ